MVIYLVLASAFKWVPVSTIMETTVLFIAAIVIFWGFIVHSEWALKKKQRTHLAFQLIASIPLLLQMF